MGGEWVAKGGSRRGFLQFASAAVRNNHLAEGVLPDDRAQKRRTTAVQRPFGVMGLRSGRAGGLKQEPEGIEPAAAREEAEDEE